MVAASCSLRSVLCATGSGPRSLLIGWVRAVATPGAFPESWSLSAVLCEIGFVAAALQLLTRGPRRHISGSVRSRFMVWGRIYWPGIQGGCPARRVMRLCAEKKVLPSGEGSTLSARYCDCG